MYVKLFRGKKSNFHLPAPQGLDPCLQCVEEAASKVPQYSVGFHMPFQVCLKKKHRNE